MIKEQLTHTDYTALATQFISAELHKLEAALYETKWWDYKPLNPMEATYEFAECYKKAMKQAIKRRKCVYRGHSYKGLKHEDFLMCSKAVITGMWKARQAADQLGIEYEFYCTQAMKYAESRDFRFLPSPSQIYSTKSKFKDSPSIVEHILTEWDKVRANRLLHARSAFYTITAFSNNRYQILHQRFLLDYIKRRKSKAALLVAELCFDKELLFKDAISQGIENGEALLRSASLYAND